jgi:spermidine synthase
LLALAVPLLLDALEPVYGILWRRFHLSFLAFSGIRFLLAGSLLLAPTIMMGATLPLLADFFAASAGRRVAPEWLYTINLIGATVGVAAGGFLLLPLVGVRATIATGAALNIIAGLLVLARLPKTWGPRRSFSEPVEGPSTSENRPASIFLAAAFISGFASLAAQVAWTRILALLVGSTTWALSTVLLAFLLSMAGGSAWASRRAGRGADARTSLAMVAALGAPALLAAMAAVNQWPSWYWTIFNALRPGGIAGAIAINAVAVLGILSIPLLLAGTIFPLALAAVTPRDPQATGRAVGTLCAVNTVGAILGATLGGVVLVPRLGSRGTLSGLCLATALFALACALPVRRVRLTAAVLASLLIVLAGLALLPAWDLKTLNAAIYEPQPGVDPRNKNRKDVVVYHREGPTATVMVLDREGETRYMRINGRVNASSGPRDIATNVLLAQIPLLVVPRGDDVLVVGLGSGVTAGAALQSPARRVTVVELEPAVVEASHLFDEVNDKPLDDLRLRLYEDDARHVLLASDALYDVIISEPSHPWVSGVSNLFTRKFFSLGASRLHDEGVFAQWLQTYQIAGGTFRSILATFQSVFPEVLVFRSYGTDLILVGSRRPLSLDMSTMEQRLLDPLVRREMNRIGIRRPEDLMAHFLTGPQDVRRFASGAPINTDDNMLVEFRAPVDLLHVGSDETQTILSGLPFTPVEEVLSDPDRLLHRRDSLHALVRALTERNRSAERYEKILMGRSDTVP